MSKEFGESHSDVVKLPAYTFSRGGGLSPEQDDLAGKEFLLKESIIYASASEMGKKEKEDIYKVFDQKISWIRDNLGLDVSGRRSDKVKLFSSEEWEKLRRQYHFGTGVFGFANVLGEIFINKDRPAWGSSLSHEILHSLSNKTVIVKRDPGKRTVVRIGFANERTHAFNYLDECLTEKISRESTPADTRGEMKCAYAEGVLFFSILNREAAARLGRDPMSLRYDLYRGYFRGDMTVLRVYDEAFGKGTLKKIAEMKGDYFSFASLCKFGEDIGISDPTLQSFADWESKVRRTPSPEPSKA